jgi:acetyl esterase/lipase
MPSNFIRLNFLIGLLFFLICFNRSYAQCSNRYLDTIFPDVTTISNVVYTTTAGGSSDTLLLDIYQPTADTACLRHLVIWVHGGAFFQGSKNDGDVEFLSKRFAQRGYVCASINYRLAPSIVSLYDSVQIYQTKLGLRKISPQIGGEENRIYPSIKWRVHLSCQI